LPRHHPPLARGTASIQHHHYGRAGGVKRLVARWVESTVGHTAAPPTRLQ
jgi:hypothetical protein